MMQNISSRPTDSKSNGQSKGERGRVKTEILKIFMFGVESQVSEHPEFDFDIVFFLEPKRASKIQKRLLHFYLYILLNQNE
jgi:hypothetical protein